MRITGSFAGAIELTKKLLAIREFAKNAEVKLLIAELQVQLADVKTQVADLMKENTKLKDEANRIASLPNLTLKKNRLYYKQDGEGPFCPTCFDVKRIVVRLVRKTQTIADETDWRCNNCQSAYFN